MIHASTAAAALTVRRRRLRRVSDTRRRTGLSTIFFLNEYECRHSAGNRNYQRGGHKWTAPIIPASWNFSRSINISQLSYSTGLHRWPWRVPMRFIRAMSDLLSMKTGERCCK